MPDSVIKKVESFARAGTPCDESDFEDRSGVLLTWNDTIDETPEGLVEEVVVLYLMLLAKPPGVTLGLDLTVTAINNEVVPYGRVNKTAALNAGLAPLDLAGLEPVGANAIDAHPYEFAANTANDDDGIIAINDIATRVPNDGAIGIADDHDFIAAQDNDDNLYDNADDDLDDNANDMPNDAGATVVAPARINSLCLQPHQ